MSLLAGLLVAGGRPVWGTPSDGCAPALLAATPAKLDRLEIAAGASEVSVLLHVPPEVSVDVRRDARGLLVIFRASGEPERVARAAPAPAPPPPAAAAEPTPAPRAPIASAPVPAGPVAPAPGVGAAPPPPPPATPPAATRGQ